MPISKKSVRATERREALVVVRVTRTEHAKLTAAAKLAQRPLSDYLRTLGLKAAK